MVLGWWIVGGAGYQKWLRTQWRSTYRPATTPAGGWSGSSSSRMNHFLSVKAGCMFPFLGSDQNFDKLNANGILDWVMLGSKLKQPFLLEHFSFCFSNQENMRRLWKPGERNVYCMYRLYQICISGLINSSFSQYNEAKNKNHHRWRKALNGHLLPAFNQEIISESFGLAQSFLFASFLTLETGQTGWTLLT